MHSYLIGLIVILTATLLFFIYLLYDEANYQKGRANKFKGFIETWLAREHSKRVDKSKDKARMMN